ncbi:MAG TPA: AraC family transcriptional regulator [Rhizobiaceae bacterium]|nr:AraC family transcriptional regulator [Rhizobiaceae bacterium]
MNAPPIALYRSPLAASAGLSVTGFGRQHVRRMVEQRSLSCYAVVFVESGQGWLKTEAAGLQPISAPTLFWLFPGRTHSYGPDGAGWDEHWALFEGALPDDFVRLGVLRENAPAVRVRKAAETRRLFDAIYANLRADSIIAQADAAATLHRMVISAARQPAGPTPSSSAADLQKIIDILRERALGAVDMADLASELGMSPATLRRKVSAATGASPKAYQLRLRLDRAKELLVTSDMSIDAISAAVGIDDPFYFSRLFRSREGDSPRAFRRRHRRE